MHSPHFMQLANCMYCSSSSGDCGYSFSSPSGTPSSSVSSLSRYGLTSRWFSKSESNPTARSRITGKFCSGSTVITEEFSSSIFVKQASLGLPFIIMPHEPQVACLHEYLTATEWSRLFLTSRIASSTVVHFSYGTSKSSNPAVELSCAGLLRAMRSVIVRCAPGCCAEA